MQNMIQMLNPQNYLEKMEEINKSIKNFHFDIMTKQN